MTIKDNRNAKDYSRYEYYRILKGIGPAIPVRMVYDDEDLRVGSDTIDAKTGELTNAGYLIGEARESPYSDCSTEEEFWDLCRQHVEYEKNKAK
jgi:hypothetical protein